ncbi:hypothetical protein ACIO6T_41290 [Streptomyces sp. NPDC087532]|uniref:hypothetical protein n=1 Tax=Streptomyces sp. NPDC087532 TaxID=3365795 RepID=UPI00382A4465
MTTTAEHRRPSPADLAANAPARRRAAARLAEILAPAVLNRGERFRPLYNAAIRESGMNPNTRLVALVLATFGNSRTGRVAEQPGLHRLAAGTGLAVGQVVVALRALETRGWVQHTGPARYEDAVLQPSIPAHVMPRLRTLTLTTTATITEGPTDA